MTPEGKYLIDEYQINYVSAGRDIMRWKFKVEEKETHPLPPLFRGEEESIPQSNVPSIKACPEFISGRGLRGVLGEKKANVAIMADPDFDLDIVIRIAKKTDDTRASVSRDMGSVGIFVPLPGTKEEAEEIEKIVKKRYNVKRYLGKEAVEEVLYNIKEPPEILHLATHGFFLKDLDLKGKIWKKLEEKGWKDVQTMRSQAHEERLRAVTREVGMETTIEDSMLRSGIALAGANTSREKGGNFGIVTAKKITGVNLRGTGLLWLLHAVRAQVRQRQGRVSSGLKGLSSLQAQRHW